MSNKKKRMRRSNSFSPQEGYLTSQCSNSSNITPKRTPTEIVSKKLKLDSCLNKKQENNANTDVRSKTINDHADDNNQDNSSICNSCHEYVEDNGISCDNCEIWYHIKCQDITSNELKMIIKLGNKVKWICSDCTGEEKFIVKQNDMLKQRIEILDENINKLNLYISKEKNSKNKVSQTKINIPKNNDNSKNNKVSNAKSPRNSNENSNIPTNTENNNEGRVDMQNLHSELADAFNDLKKELVEDLKNVIDKKLTESIQKNTEDNRKSQTGGLNLPNNHQNDKENNIVIYNISEPEDENPKDREYSDFQSVSQILDNGVQIEHYTIMKVIRLGTRNNDQIRPRPVLVKLANKSEKWHVIKNVKNLKYADDNMKQVSITPDYTKEEQQKQKELYEQIKVKRSNGEYNWFIKNGELCQGQNFGAARN